MKAKIIFSLILAVFAITSQAQQIEYKVRELKLFIHSQKITSEDWKNELTEIGIEGSAYLNEEFTTGTVYTTENSKYPDVPLRYNAYNDEMEFKNTNGEILAIAQPERIEKIDIGKISYNYVPFTLGKKIKRGYLELVTEGNASLYIRHNIVFKEAQKAAPMKEPAPPRFIQNSDEYYIRIGTGPANLVVNKKNLPEVFLNHKEKLEPFIKKNKIKTNDRESLAELVKYYNTL